MQDTGYNPFFEHPHSGQLSSDVNSRNIQLTLFGIGILLMLLTGNDLYVCASIGAIILMFIGVMYRAISKEEKAISKMEEKIGQRTDS
jgi:hypothetical protein